MTGYRPIADTDRSIVSTRGASAYKRDTFDLFTRSAQADQHFLLPTKILARADIALRVAPAFSELLLAELPPISPHDAHVVQRHAVRWQRRHHHRNGVHAHRFVLDQVANTHAIYAGEAHLLPA